MQTATQQRPIALLQPITPQSDFSQDQRIFRRKPRSVVDGHAGKPPAEAIQVGSAARSSAERPAGNEPSREIATFREEGDYWTLSFAGQTVRLKNIKGLAHIAYLIRRPGVDVHSIELARRTEAEFGEAEAATPRTSVAELKASGLQVGYLGDAGELLDDQAKAAYR
ncbi:MAG TPA: hypothetical protein VEY94_01800, partial [Patescibacteria group bacterium]|nr:hypothetical protein [Patescibacteria group bacterium]